MSHGKDNGSSIADRTISLQYRQFRTPRKESKQLICNTKKTYLLSEREIQTYQRYLKKNLNGNSDEFTILNLKEIHVDIEGFSIDAAKKFGNNYMENKCVLVSTKQIECDSIRDSHFGKYVRTTFNNYRNIIEQILPGEAIIGVVNQKSLDTLMDNPGSLFNIEIIFDTPNNALSKLKNIRKDERILLENDKKLKDREFLKNLLQNIEEVSIEHGSLDRIPDKDIDIKEKIDVNKLCLNTAAKCHIDVYCIRSADGTNIFVYFDDTLQLEEEFESYKDDNIIILNGKDINSLNVLIELGIIGYNHYLGLERVANMTIRNNEDEKSKALLTTVNLLVENDMDKDFFYSLGKIKIYMTYPLIQNEILYELLTRMENDEYKSCYMNTEKFLQTVSDMDSEKFRDFIEKILDSLEFVEENNIIVNIWLMENRTNLCRDLGIKFV
jgi:hypothetical protein